MMLQLVTNEEAQRTEVVSLMLLNSELVSLAPTTIYKSIIYKVKISG